MDHFQQDHQLEPHIDHFRLSMKGPRVFSYGGSKQLSLILQILYFNEITNSSSRSDNFVFGVLLDIYPF